MSNAVFITKIGVSEKNKKAALIVPDKSFKFTVTVLRVGG